MVRRIFLIWSNPLFRDSAHALLNHPDVLWVGATNDQAAARETILALKPDTILVEIVDDTPPQEMIALVSGSQFNVRLIGASLSENRLEIFDHEQQTLVHAEDLLCLVLQ